MDSLNGGFSEGMTLTDPRSPGSPRRPPIGDGPRLSRRRSCTASITPAAPPPPAAPPRKARNNRQRALNGNGPSVAGSSMPVDSPAPAAAAKKQGKPRRQKGKAAAPPAAPAAPSAKKGPPPISALQAAAQCICAAVRNLRRQKLPKGEYRATLRVLASEAARAAIGPTAAPPTPPPPPPPPPQPATSQQPAPAAAASLSKAARRRPRRERRKGEREGQSACESPAAEGSDFFGVPTSHSSYGPQHPKWDFPLTTRGLSAYPTKQTCLNLCIWNSTVGGNTELLAAVTRREEGAELELRDWVNELARRAD
eukprot:gene9450-23126_t